MWISQRLCIYIFVALEPMPKEILLQSPLTEELKRLLNQTAENSDATPIEHVMTLLDAYKQQVRSIIQFVISLIIV